MRGLGADEVIDYTQVTVPDVVSGLDVVLDPVGRAARDWLPVIKPGGTLLPFGADDDPALLVTAAERGITVKLVMVEPDGHALETLAALTGEGRLRVHVDATLPWLARPGHMSSASSGAPGGRSFSRSELR